MLRDFVFVAGRRDAKLFFEKLDEGGTDFLLQFDDIAEAFVFWAVVVEFLEQRFGAVLALHFTVALDEREHRQFLFLGSPVFRVGYGQLANQCAILGGYDEQINVTAIK